MPQDMEEISEVVQSFFPEGNSECFNVPVPQILEQTVKLERLVPAERLCQRTVERKGGADGSTKNGRICAQKNCFGEFVCEEL